MAKSKTESGEKETSHMQMVRQALEERGYSAMPLDLQTHIKSKFGVELPTQKISNYKFQIRRSEGKAGPGRGRRSAAAPSGGGLKVEDFEVIRSLVVRLGADQVKKLVDVVG